MGLPYKPWGETDFWLTQGLANYQDRVCHCGSGLFYADCVDPLTEHHLVVEEEIHYGKAALERHREQNPESDPGSMISVRLLSDDEQRLSAEERAAQEIAEMKARHGLA